MSSPTDDQIRLAILETLYKATKTNPVSGVVKKDELQAALKIPENEIEFNMLYLEGKRLITRAVFFGPPTWTAKITSRGMDAVEHKELFAGKLPFTQVSIQQINAPVQGNVVQAVNSRVDFNQQVTDAFKQAFDNVQKAQITSEKKEDIILNLKTLEEELRKGKEGDGSRVQRAWGWIQSNASWLVPTLTQTISDWVKVTLGIH